MCLLPRALLKSKYIQLDLMMNLVIGESLRGGNDVTGPFHGRRECRRAEATGVLCPWQEPERRPAGRRAGVRERAGA